MIVSGRGWRGYETLEGLEHVFLEDSWVLGIATEPTRVSFRLEIVLLEGHPRYAPPPPSAQYHYLDGWLRFKDAVDISWSGGQASDVDLGLGAEGDLGNIDSFLHQGARHELSGSWGRVLINTRTPPSLVFADEALS